MLNKNITYKSIIDETKEKFIEACDKKTFERERGFALQAFMANSKLQQLLSSPVGQNSARHAVMNLATIGLTLNPTRKEAFLVPRGQQICLDISYQGLINLAMEDSTITYLIADVVTDKDKFELSVLNELPIHIKDHFGDNKNTIGAYCCVRFPSGDYQTKTLDIKDLNKIKGKAMGTRTTNSNSPWYEFTDEMYIKSAIKRASKLWPKSANSKLEKAIKYANEADGFQDAVINSEVVNPEEIEDQRTQLLQQKAKEFA